MTYHSIDDIADKCKVIYTKAENLKNNLWKLNHKEIVHALDDIRALCGDIYNDRGTNGR